jgi:hypothetical protein
MSSGSTEQRSTSGFRAMWYVLIAIAVVVLTLLKIMSREPRAALNTTPDAPTVANVPAQQTDNRDPRDAPIERWLPFFPDLLDYLQYQTDGNKEKAALTMLSLPPAEDTVRLSKRLDAALAIHGMEPLRAIADQMRSLPPGPQRSAKTDELITLLSVRSINAAANSFLRKMENGEKPTERDLWILEAAANVLKDVENKQ